MSLDNIQITPALVKDLYGKSLVDLEMPKDKSNDTAKIEYPLLGSNQKNILIIVNEKNTAFIGDEDLNFLLGILGACRLTMADVAIINIFEKKELKYKTLIENFVPDKILFFGTKPADLDFPLQFPDYQLQKYNHQTYLSAPALTILAKDVSEKKQLWASLKILFEIA